MRFPLNPEGVDRSDDPRECLRGGRLYVESGVFENHLSLGYWLGTTLKDRLQCPWLSALGVDAATTELLALYDLALRETERRCALFQKRVWKKEED